ncbi:hypothetical protein BDI4_580019 [Burkholderia diffusa]|nr:hypothetical protein BDI4_580019 [Burkholderia diffusa]
MLGWGHYCVALHAMKREKLL